VGPYPRDAELAASDRRRQVSQARSRTFGELVAGSAMLDALFRSQRESVVESSEFRHDECNRIGTMNEASEGPTSEGWFAFLRMLRQRERVSGDAKRD
jgi:hypothetical protein